MNMTMDKRRHWHVFLLWLWDMEDRHPYRFSFCIAFAVTLWILFSTSSMTIPDENMMPSDNIEFISMDDVRNVAVRRVARSEVSLSDKSAQPAVSDVERATGFSDDPDAVDLAFHPSVVPPKPVGRLVRRYPRIAREAGVEAVLKVEILITAGGAVQGVRVLDISLSKTLPPEIHSSMAKAFAHDAVEILKGIRFTPPVVQGRLVPVRFEMPLRFRLEE